MKQRDAEMIYVGFWTDKGKANESTSDFLKQLRGNRCFCLVPLVLAAAKNILTKS